ncbi:MAG: tetratricopeptide repeat protein [Planctomycetota bacterium]|nr:tetratricopeptide repeat protein [Planctomycetota bacterium]
MNRDRSRQKTTRKTRLLALHLLLLLLASLQALGGAAALEASRPGSRPGAPPGGAGLEEDDPEETVDPRQLARTGDYEEAAVGFRGEIEKDPARADSRRGLAEVLAARGKYDEALEVLRKASNFDETPDLLVAAGHVERRLGRLAGAEKLFRAAVSRDDDHVEALTRLGEVLVETGRREEAEKLWNRVVEVYEALSAEEAEKLPAEDYVEMGVALAHLNRFHEANVVMFAQAEEQDEKCPRLMLEWGRVFMEKYDFPYSREFLRDALDQNPNFADARVIRARNYLVDFQVGTRRYGLAEKELSRALEVNPRHAGAYTARGSLWLSDGDLPQAVADFEKALEINPASLETLGLLGACHHLSSDEEGFQRAEKKAHEINPRPARFYHTVAVAIEKRFRYQDAVAMSEKALGLEPDYWPVYHTLGINYLRTGREKEGRDYLQKSYDRDPFNVWVVNTRKLLRHMDKNHVKHVSENFRFSFPRRDADLLKSHLVPLLEKAYERLAARYRVKLDPPIHVDVFSSHQWFSARIAGLPGFPATGACFGNVVALTTPKALPQNWGAVAWHEFAHVVTLAATNNRVPRWLTEGLSVYEEGRDQPQWARNFEREIADARGSARLLRLGELDSGFSKPKYPGQVLISYFQGCLVVQYIAERWSFEKILDVLARYGENKPTPRVFREVFDVELEEFDKSFFAWLDRWVEANGYQPRAQLSPEKLQLLDVEVEENPKDPRRLCDLSWAYYSSGNDDDAQFNAAKALKADAEYGDAHAILGFVRLGQKKYSSAKTSLEKAAAGGSRFGYRIHRSLGDIARRKKNGEQAIAHYEKAREISPRAGAAHPPGRNLYYRLADLYNKNGQEEKAVQKLEEVRRITTQDAKCRMQLVQHYRTQEDEDSARRALGLLDELVYINPFSRKLHEQLAETAVRLKEHEVIVREYTYLLGFADTNPRIAYLALARAHLGLGNKDEAARYARKVLAIDDENEEARELLEKIE